ncbi:MAG: hypothetical protein LWY06_04220 [Firmicutes bacterium]|nr:hypothetical protein [Bacillota bacterium]
MKEKNFSKLIALPVLLAVLLFLCSCNMGKWQADGKIVFFEDGGADVLFKLYPMDSDANNSFGAVMEGIKKEEPKAIVSEKKEGKNRVIMISRLLSPRQNIYLKKENGKWKFRYLNQFMDNVSIRELEVIMPGWVTTTNAQTRIGNYVKWETIYEGTPLTAESLTVSTPSMVGIGFVVVTFIIVAIAVFFLIRREKKEKTAPPSVKSDSEDFRY